MRLKTVGFYMLRKVWQCFAVTLVLLAVLISALKYTLPYANDYKQNIESILYQQFDVDIAIGSISASWQGNGPALVLEDLSFADNATSPIALTIANTSLQLNLLESIKNGQLRSSYFVIEGLAAQVDVERLDAGSSGDFEQQSLLESLFLGETGRFEVKDSRLQVRLRDGKQRVLLIDSLRWQNQPQQHRGFGKIALPGISEGEISANLALTGRYLKDVAGDIFIAAQGVDVATWLAPWLDKEKKALNTDLNANLWLSVTGGKINSAQWQWQPSFIHWQQQQRPQQLSLDSGMFSAQLTNQHWDIQSTPWQFSDGGRALPELKWQAKLGPENHALWLEELSIPLLTRLADLAAQPELKQVLALQPTGQVNVARFEWHSSADWRVYAGVGEFGWQPQGGIPGAQNLRLEVSARPDAMRVTLDGEADYLLTGELFSRALAFDQLHVSADIYTTEQGWQVSSHDIWFANPDLTVAAELGLALSDTPSMALYAEVNGGNANIAEHYFPLTVMDADLIAYLKGAIQAGQHRKSQVLFNGPFAHFPFTTESGQFEVRSQLEEVKFAFAPGWPAVEQASVELAFVDQRMDIYAHSGKLINQQIATPVTVSIADLMDAKTLFVDIKHQTEAASLQAFFTETPLKKPLAEVLNVVQATGPVNGDVRLAVDLGNGHVKATGVVDFVNNVVHVTKPGLVLKQVNGQLEFADEQITLNALYANWLGQPLELKLTGQSDAQKNYQLLLSANLQGDAERLADASQGLTRSFIVGNTAVNTAIELNFTAQGFNYRATASSDLTGLSSSLPAPYGKTSQTKLPLNIEVQGDDISNLITANIDKKLFFNGILDNHNGVFANAQLVVGEKDLGLTNQGFVVAIEQPQFELEPWLPFLDNLLTVTSGVSPSGVLPPLSLVSGQFARVQAGPLPFNDVEFSLTPSTDGFSAKIIGKELRATVAIPRHGSSRPILINADYLRLQPEVATPNSKPAPQPQWLTRLPAIEATCLDCKLAQYQLDKVNLSLFGDGQQLQVTELRVDKGEHVLSANGRWVDGRSEFTGKLNSKNVGMLLDEFDITTSIKDASAEVDFTLNWQDAPYSFALPTLGGEINWRLGEGHLSEISDGGARVFSLLSMDSLVRKLKLDFRDVFSKGFFFNQMQGNMQLQAGIAYTKDAKLDGVPADLTISGHANLVSKEINYDLAVAPQVTSSLPVIVAWMVNPVSGLAALALDKVIHSARVISEIKFKVTGTMDNPQVQEIDRKSREVELPQAAQNQPSAEPLAADVPQAPDNQGPAT
ncbi:YhdP family protein [Pseudoalteromonas fenneropenaei]|uniref:YhdP family protein n=1 Tax=Pseudoalteromonas fenneropenaei TaxID=1737459 RepID=A0ABV7CKK2_9GAMM